MPEIIIDIDASGDVIRVDGLPDRHTIRVRKFDPEVMPDDSDPAIGEDNGMTFKATVVALNGLVDDSDPAPADLSRYHYSCDNCGCNFSTTSRQARMICPKCGQSGLTWSMSG